MCHCIDVEVGSYANQAELIAPHFIKTMRVKWNAQHGTDISEEVITVDKCLVDEILELWDLGIRTTGCCCGHNKLPGYIGVIDEDIQKMISLGYVNVLNTTNPQRNDSFSPKSIK
ncbi:hypothetical protein [Paenibacillus lactis]|uniref:hypothetical protein n=1 Tax=Paenibacillus lactis TaxID=228574 RepID=UPI003D75FD57